MISFGHLANAGFSSNVVADLAEGNINSDQAIHRRPMGFARMSPRVLQLGDASELSSQVVASAAKSAPEFAVLEK